MIMKNNFIFSIDKADKVQDLLLNFPGHASFHFGVPADYLHLRSQADEFCYITYNAEYFNVDDFWRLVNATV